MILSSMDENKQLEQQLAYWNDIPDYYHLRFSNITTKLPDNSRNFTREEKKRSEKDQSGHASFIRTSRTIRWDPFER